MRINTRQHEIIQGLIQSLKENFPEVRFVDITESPENPNDLWINVTKVKNEDRFIELIKYFAEKCTDILLDYGYHISVMPVR